MRRSTTFRGLPRPLGSLGVPARCFVHTPVVGCPAVHRRGIPLPASPPKAARYAAMREPQAAGSAALRDRRPARYAALDETVLRMLAAGDGVVSYDALRGLGYLLKAMP